LTTGNAGEPGQGEPGREAGPIPIKKNDNRRSYLLVLLIFLPFLILAAIYLKISIQAIFVHNDIRYPEGASVYAFMMALRTGNLYSSPFDFPYNAQMYGPVFYLFGLASARVAHGNPMLATEAFRLLSFLSFLGSAGLIGYLAWKLESVKCWVAVTVVLSLACTWSLPFSACVSADELSIFLILASLSVYQAAQGRNQLIFWAGVLGSLSFMTKQSTAPVFFALIIDSLMARRFRGAAALIAGSVPIPALILFALWLRQEPFLANFLIVRQALYDWPSGFAMLINLLRTNQIAVIPISMAFLGAGLNWRMAKYRTILLAAGFGCISNLAAFANIGANRNYLILPWLLMILTVPAALVRIEKWARNSALIPLALTLLGGFLLLHQRNVLAPEIPPDSDTHDVEKLKILSSWPYLEMRSRQPQLLDPFLYRQLALQKLWSFAPIIRQIDGEEYDLIMIRGDDGPTDSEFLVKSIRGISGWAADTVGPIASHYRTLCEVPFIIVLVPRDRSVAFRDEDIARILHQPCRATNRLPQLEPGMR
jgi:hypothetical protein